MSPSIVEYQIRELSREIDKAKPGGTGGGSERPNGGNLVKSEVLAQSGISTSEANRCEIYNQSLNRITKDLDSQFGEMLETALKVSMGTRLF